MGKHYYPDDFMTYVMRHIGNLHPEGCSHCGGDLYVGKVRYMAVTSLSGGQSFDVTVDPLVKGGCTKCGAVMWFDEITLNSLFEGQDQTSAEVIRLVPNEKA